MPDHPPSAPPRFDAAFRESLAELFRWRRDVRRFRTDALEDETLDELLAFAALAPSVGNSQPWRFVKVKSPMLRADVRANFERCNRRALAAYEGERAKLYASLKLAGLEQAPQQIAVFADEAAREGHGLGQATMPETLAYSAVMAIYAFWLAARARGIGVGWVSILDPADIVRALAVPPSWRLIAYLCVGWPEEEHLDPELARAGWQERLDPQRFVSER